MVGFPKFGHILEYQYVYHELLYVHGKKDHGKVSPQTHIIPMYVINVCIHSSVLWHLCVRMCSTYIATDTQSYQLNYVS